MEYGILCLAPVVVALVLCFVTKDALLSILLGVIVGTVIMGQNPVFGLSSILQNALGNADFIWVAAIEVFIGIMVAYFQKSGAIKAFADKIAGMGLTRRMTGGAAAILGLIVYFSDYFSPLYVGNVMRPLTDKALISREKLAFICDCTSAPVACMLGPFASWGVYMAGLLVGLGTIADADMGMTAVMKAVPFNFYCIIMFVFCLLNSFNIIPDFGPMKKAEKRALEEGKVVRDGAQPMLSKELGEIIPNDGVKASILLDFLIPALIIFSIILGTFIFMGSAKTLEAFIATVFYQFLRMLICRMATLKELMATAVDGIKAVLSAILILAMAYCINSITKGLGTADFIISLTESFMTPALLVTVTFLTCAIISFLTGSSWGTFAIMTPIAIPLAFTVSGGELTTLVFMTIGAIEGGGTFGDHCSPMSDTTILSSLAAGSDHMDHNATQIPYAVLCAAIACVVTLVLGFTM
ncbi:MAG: transporter [Firmicutes bacterium]|nr:transporter [Bacillota bacterium]